MYRLKMAATVGLVGTAHHTVHLAGCNGVSNMLHGRPQVHICLFCLLTYPFNWKWASQTFASGHCSIILCRNLNVAREVKSPLFVGLTMDMLHLNFVRKQFHTLLVKLPSWVAEKDVLQISRDSVSMPARNGKCFLVLRRTSSHQRHLPYCPSPSQLFQTC